MDALRCTDCGDVRWSLLGFKGPTGACEICGGEMLPERRRPDLAARGDARERREPILQAQPAQDPSRPSA